MTGPGCLASATKSNRLRSAGGVQAAVPRAKILNLKGKYDSGGSRTRLCLPEVSGHLRSIPPVGVGSTTRGLHCEAILRARRDGFADRGSRPIRSERRRCVPPTLRFEAWGQDERERNLVVRERGCAGTFGNVGTIWSQPGAGTASSPHRRGASRITRSGGARLNRLFVRKAAWRQDERGEETFPRVVGQPRRLPADSNARWPRQL